MQPLTRAWKDVPLAPRGATLLGISFRPFQVEAFGLDGRATLETLLAYPFQLIRLGAYWSRIEPQGGEFDTSEFDWAIEAAERAGKQVILAVGAVKTFGYPEFFVPGHWLSQPLREGSLVRSATHPTLLLGATQFIRRIVTRYKDRAAIVAWRLEHEAIDPLGMEHTWRLADQFVESELEALRVADPTRPVIMSGFLPTSSPVRLSQWWRRVPRKRGRFPFQPPGHEPVPDGVAWKAWQGSGSHTHDGRCATGVSRQQGRWPVQR